LPLQVESSAIFRAASERRTIAVDFASVSALSAELSALVSNFRHPDDTSTDFTN
jgi:hypothetical protein